MPIIIILLMLVGVFASLVSSLVWQTIRFLAFIALVAIIIVLAVVAAIRKKTIKKLNAKLSEFAAPEDTAAEEVVAE